MSKYVDIEIFRTLVDDIKIEIDEDVMECKSVHEELIYLLKRIEKAVNDLIDSQPAADVVPVVHGRWIDKGRKIECSECDGRVYLGTDNPGLHKAEKAIRKFCFKCGAKMVNP